MKTNIIQEMLLQSNPEITEMAKYIHALALNFIAPVMTISLLIEYLRDWNFTQVLKQTFIALIAIFYFSTIHINSVKYSLEGSSQFIIKYSRNNHFVKKWAAATTVNRDSSVEIRSLWNSMKSLVKTVTNDAIAFTLWIICTIIFLILKQLYSFVYYLTYAFFPICAVLSIFPLTRSSMNGAMKSSLWCMLMPFMVAIMICIVGNTVEFKSSDSSYLASNLEGLIQLVVSVILILWTTSFTQKIIDGTGMSQVATQIGHTASMAVLMATKTRSLQSSKGAMVWTAMKGANRLGAAANNIRKKSGTTPTAGDVLKKSLKSPKVGSNNQNFANKTGPKENTEALSTAKTPTNDPQLAVAQSPNAQKLRKSEKAILMADKMVNFFPNRRAESSRLNHAQKIAENTKIPLDKIKMPLSNYKEPYKTSFPNQVLGMKPSRVPFNNHAVPVMAKEPYNRPEKAAHKTQKPSISAIPNQNSSQLLTRKPIMNRPAIRLNKDLKNEPQNRL